MLTDLTIMEARIDYLAVSARSPAARDGLTGIASVGLVDEQKRGQRLAMSRPHGYDVARAGSWSLGQKEGSTIVSVGGIDSERWARALLSYGEHCSRIDYAVTAQMPDCLQNPVRSAMHTLNERYGRADGSDNIVAFRGLARYHGLGIGRRASPYYGRIYNKTLESKGLWPRDCWRWEIELKKHASEQEHSMLNGQPKRFDLAGTIVRDHFARWNVEIPGIFGPTVVMAKQIRKPSDADRSIKWLREQVRPTVAWLYDIGRGDDVQWALFGNLGLLSGEAS